jgi:hypothetical protein
MSRDLIGPSLTPGKRYEIKKYWCWHVVPMQFYRICNGMTREMSYVRYSDSLRTGRFGARTPVRGEIFRYLPDRPWSPSSLLYIGYKVAVPGVRRLGRNHPPHLAPRLKKECSYTFTPLLCLHGLL